VRLEGHDAGDAAAEQVVEKRGVEKGLAARADFRPSSLHAKHRGERLAFDDLKIAAGPGGEEEKFLLVRGALPQACADDPPRRACLAALPWKKV